MSTQYHDPIVAGESNRPDTVNTRLSDIDAGIVEQKERLDTLIIESGTSDAETIDARGGYAALSERVGDLNLKSGYLLVDASFEGNSAAKRFQTITAAMAAATEGCTIQVAPGTYVENVTFSQANITLVGAGTPYFDGTDLIGGVIIEGRIDCNGKRGATVKDLGVDIRDTAQVDAINSDSGTSGTTAIYQEFHNLIAIGKGAASAPDRGHGILCGTGGGNVIKNCKFYHWYHGVALRCSNSIVSDCYFYACNSDSVIIKGDTGTGNANNNAVTNCVLDGATASAYDRAGPIRIQNVHASTITRFNVISNITSQNTGEAVVIIQQTAGTCATTMVSNVIAFNGGDASIRADFDVDTATDVHFTNCVSATRSNGWGFRNTGGSRIRAMNCSSDFTGAGRVTGTFDYLDLGAGLGVDLARIQNITFDQQTNAVTMRDMAIVTGQITTLSATAVDAITCAWTGSGTTTSLSIDLLVTYTSGSIARTFQFQIAIMRPNSTTLTAAIQQVGSTLNTSGSGNNMTAAVDVATANTAKIQFTGVTGAGTAGYTARIVSMTTSSWAITAH